MPPEERPWSLAEPPDPLALLDQAVGDLIALVAPPPLAVDAAGSLGPLPDGGVFLPPIAGAQSFPGFLGDAWDWVEGQLLAPAGDFLKDALAEIGRTVAGTVTTIVEWILKWVYHTIRASIYYLVPSNQKWRFPLTTEEDTRSPMTYLKRLIQMLVFVGEGLLSDAADWLWDQVRGLIGTITGGFTNLVDWLRKLAFDRLKDVANALTDAADWLWGQVRGLIGTVSGGFTNLVDWIRQVVWDRLQDMLAGLSAAADWLWDQVRGLFGTITGGFTNLVDWLRQLAFDRLKDVANALTDAADWLWGQVGPGITFLGNRITDVADWLWDNILSEVPKAIIAGAAEIGTLIREAFEWFVNEAFGPVLATVNAKLAIPGKLIRMEYSSLEELLEDVLDPPETMIKGPFAIAFVPGVLIGLITMFLTTAIGPFSEPVAQEYRKLVGARIPPFAMLRAGFLRELLPESVHDDWLGRSGFELENIALQKALYEEIPGPTDLVRMGVREVFTPEIAERFGQFEDFPPAFGEWMAKQGFTDFWAKAFWGAHWDLPSVTQGFEMFHRGVIDDADLDLLLRALDVMPFWRDNLKEIAFRVISRVDVRRMYAEGVFDRDQVKRVYLDLGYKPEDAEALTEFVVLRYPPKGRESDTDLRSLTTSSIKQAYARRLITGDDALERLMELDYSVDDAALIVSIWEFDWFQDPSLRSDVDPKGLARSTIEKAYERRLIDLNAGVLELGELGYTPEDARLLLQLVDLRLDEQLADLEIDGLVSDYQDGIITDAQLAAALADLNIPRARIDFLLQREILQREAKRRRLTLSQMKKALAADLMEESEYRARLAATGYNDRDVDILVALNVEAV